MLQPTDVAPAVSTTRCKVCSQDAPLYGVVDFNKSCEELNGRRLPLIGVAVWYHQCASCGLVFTEALDDWSKSRYLEHIYNDRYVDVDPDYVEVRPRDNARIVRAFMKPGPALRHLDYGGGNGTMSALLRDCGIDSSTWDPMDAVARDPEGTFGLVTAFEVFEHTPAPIETLREIVGFCDAAVPLIFFSTYTVDALPPRSMDFWYLAPRNGHITVHTEPSLQALFRAVDLRVHHFGNGWHLAHRELPAWIDLSLFVNLYPPRGVRRLVVALGLHREGRLRKRLGRLAGGRSAA